MRGLLRFHGTRHVELDKLPKLDEEIERKCPGRLLVEFDAFENDCLNIHFSINQLQIKVNEKSKTELNTGNRPRRRALRLIFMRSDSELQIFTFHLTKGLVFICSPILQSPAG